MDREKICQCRFPMSNFDRDFSFSLSNIVKNFQMYCQPMYPNSKVPTKSTDGSAAFDLHTHIFPLDQHKNNDRINELNSKCYNGITSTDSDHSTTVSYEQESKRGFITINPGGRMMIPTGIKVKCPEFMSFNIKDRSGLAYKNGLFTLGGVIDSDYRGEVLVIVTNIHNTPFNVYHGDRISQLNPRVDYIPFLTYPHLIPVDDINNLNDVDASKEIDKLKEGSLKKNRNEDRGERGFGSTGV